MADAISHLHESARTALDLSVEDRIERIRRPRWIGYTRAIHILEERNDGLSATPTA